MMIFEVLRFTAKSKKIALFCPNACVCRKFVVILRAKLKVTTIMTTTQAYSSVRNLAFLLPIVEQEQLVRDIQAHMSQHPSEQDEYLTLEEKRARIRESEAQIARGEVYSEEESDRMFDAFIVNELGIAL